MHNGFSYNESVVVIKSPLINKLYFSDNFTKNEGL